MIKRLFKAIQRSQERRATEHLLRTLTPRQLKDIGITRCDIPRIISEID